MLPPEIFLEYDYWWAPILAKHFAYINHHGKFPNGWDQSIVIPIYKKGDKTLPANYRPISLLELSSKLYARFILTKVKDWVLQNNIIGEEQAGFCCGKSAIDHCFILNHLREKYTCLPKKFLYATFVNLTSAFDRINRERLWH